MKSTLHLVRLLTCAFLLAAPVSAAAQSRFLSAIDDLPLMAGLDEVEGAVMVFDSPAGRIVEALSAGDVKKDKVLKYYSETLPQLGWRETTPGQFRREDETLKLEFSKVPTISGAATTSLGVRFLLSPTQ